MFDPSAPLTVSVTKAAGGRLTQGDNYNGGYLVQRVAFDADMTGCSVTSYAARANLDLSDVEAEVREAIGAPPEVPLGPLLKTVVIEAVPGGERLVVNGHEVPYKRGK